ncbi:hypothetical protein ECHLIB_0558 [Ehrlichia chaffeensis str. Liberty]|nr:hypothetical protein ECHJAX_0556 [Ehrlichia chaffeensis str. Jax]AHX06610.1 hypothetical protein ECHLIB_0558 [Ehrlichia chaffeensis str. Liberty]
MSKSKDAEYIKNIKMSAVICLICSIAPFIIVNIFQNSNNRKGQILNGSGQENDMLPPSTSNTFRNTLTILSTGVNIIHSIAIL